MLWVMGMKEESFEDRYRRLEDLMIGRCLRSYLAVDGASGMEVAVDVVECDRSASPHLIGRLKEVLALAEELSDPCIVPLFAWHEEGSRVYMVREKASGTPLGEILADTGQLPGEQVVEIVEAAVGALAEAYGRGLFYLGLNPSQFLLDGRGGVRLIRVGYGWLLEEMEPLLAARVSPYRAPETDGAGEGTRTSDVYSLAVMVREMFPERLISDRLRSLLEKSTSPHPRQRPSSPRLLLEGLRESVNLRHGGMAGLPDEPAADPSEGEEGDSRVGHGSDFDYGEKAVPIHMHLGRRQRSGILRTLLKVFMGGLIVWLLYAAVMGFLAGRGKGPEEAPVVAEEEKVKLPDLQGLPAQEAEETLRNLGLNCIRREAPSRLWSAGFVAAQEPQEGTILGRGDTVCLVISSGREETQETAPAGEAETSTPNRFGTVREETAPSGAYDASPASDHGVSRESSPSRAAPLPPRAVAVLSCRGGSSPLYVCMDAGRSRDPDGYITRYVWDCGDGTVLEGARVQHVFDPPVTPMRYRVLLTVFDREGLSDSCLTTVEVY